MAVYVDPFTFDFAASVIDVDVGVSSVEVDSLYDAVKLAQASEEGILYGQIAAGSGLADLGGGVQVGLTVELLGSWQLRFAAGAYIARVAAGNLVGGPSGDPIAYSAGVQVLLIQSAAATVVNVDGGGGTAPTASQNAAAVRLNLASELARIVELAKIHGLVSGMPLVVTPTGRAAGDVAQTIEESGSTVTVSRS